MRRTLAVFGIAVSAILFGAGTADAATAHHVTTKCSTSCRPAKTPPKGGWPCKADKSCGTKHHYPVCPPTTTPPVVTSPSSKPHPPVVTTSPPKGHVTHHATKPSAPAVVPHASAPELPRTGGVDDIAGLAGIGFLAFGGVARYAARKQRQH